MTEHLIFGVSLATFMEHWHAQDPPDLYWKSDACTAAADNPLGYKCMVPKLPVVFLY